MTTPTVSLPYPPPPSPTRRHRLTPLPDPPQRPMASQSPYTARAHLILEARFRECLNALVMQEGYLCRHAGEARGAPAPDCIVAFDLLVPPAEIIAANGYIISEVGKPPDFVLEVASRSTGRRDYTVKRILYATYGVVEYWRFDPTGGDFHDAALAGDRLVNGEYRPIRIYRMAGGGFRGYSAALDLELRWEMGRLRFWDPSTRDYLPDLIESRTQTDTAIAQRDAEAAARNEAIVQRDDAIAQRDDAIVQRDDAIIQRDDAIVQRDAEAAARRRAEERIRRLEARLAQFSDDDDEEENRNDRV